MAKRANGIAEFSQHGATLRWTFGAPVADVMVDAEAVFPSYYDMTECQRRVVVNGLKQRIADGMAKSNATVAEKAAAAREIAESLENGVYELTPGSLLERALMEYKPSFGSVKEVKAWIKSQADKHGVSVKTIETNLATAPAIKEILDRMRPANAERGEQILSELD